MSIIVTCDRTDCGNRAIIGLDDGDWSKAGPLALRLPGDDEDFGDILQVYLPAGWRVDRVGLDSVIHCEDHADVGEPPA